MKRIVKAAKGNIINFIKSPESAWKDPPRKKKPQGRPSHGIMDRLNRAKSLRGTTEVEEDKGDGFFQVDGDK
jgi:hypothetical protein